MAFGSLILSAGFAAALVWQSARGTVVSWVVQVDRLGQAQTVAPATADYRPTDPQIAFHLGRFIEQVRSINAAHPGFVKTDLHGVDAPMSPEQGAETSVKLALLDELRHAGPVFMLGYCCGGSIAWASVGRLNGLSAAVCYYGGKLPTLASETPLCPTLVHLGRDDSELPMRSTRDALEQHSAAEVLTYPAGHGFNSDRRADFDQQCSDLAFRETLRLLEKQGIQRPPARGE